jgi:hypothetical protein
VSLHAFFKLVVDWADRQRFKNIVFVGSHPMAGGHERGLKAARSDLYDKALCFVIHGKKTNPSALHKTVHFWKVFCRSVHVVDAKTHDQIVAKISHLPHVLSSLLVYGTDSKTLPFVLVGLFDVIMIALIGVFWFEAPLRGNPLVLLLGAVLFLMSSVAIGLFISTICTTQQQAQISTFFFMMPAFILSGFAFPLEICQNGFKQLLMRTH